MNILAVEYSLAHRALELYLAGCNGPHCEGCHNPESWDFGGGSPLWPAFPSIEDKLGRYTDLISRVWILGGEPLDQDRDQLLTLLEALRLHGKELWLWTRYALEDIPEDVLRLCDYVKTGRYMKALATTDNVQFGITLASSNQAIHQLGATYGRPE